MSDTFVTLNDDGAVTGIYAMAQPQLDGFTAIDSSDPRIAAFFNPPSVQYVANIANGIALTCTGAPVLNATYALDDTTLAQIQALANDCGVGFGFPGGAPTFNYPDITGFPHTFTPAQIINLYKQMRGLIFAMQTTLAMLEAGAPAEWPVQTATIP